MTFLSTDRASHPNFVSRQKSLKYAVMELDITNFETLKLIISFLRLLMIRDGYSVQYLASQFFPAIVRARNIDEALEQRFEVKQVELGILMI
jgi:hypothetical protein